MPTTLAALSAFFIFVAIACLIAASLWAGAFMLVAWLVSYPLTWSYAYAAAIVMCLVVGALKRSA